MVMPYTPRDASAKITRIPALTSAMIGLKTRPPSKSVRPKTVISGSTNARPHGTTAMVVSAGSSPNVGASVYSHLCACAGMMSSLRMNFSASANDWNKPNGPTRFGPGRS
jgi:hypothetical protein